ncbi:MAG: pseudouridine synthase [Comamonadaceae bacterium]
MIDSKKTEAPATVQTSFRRAAPPPQRAPIPQGQTNTAALGANGTLRLNKRMAELGLASRREADDWIAKGWVKVNGRVAEMGMQVAPDVKIEIDKLAKGQQANLVTVLINKPLGLVSGQAEDGHEPAITLVQPENRWAEDNARFFFHGSQLKSLVPAGRLDIDSTGLLVLTQDGRVARQLIGEDAVMEKEYLVRVIYTGVLNTAAATSAAATYPGRPLQKPAAPTQLSRIDDDDPISADVQAVFPAEKLQLLRHGLSLDGQALKHAKVEWQNPEQLRFVLHEGKKRQIRRMCEQVGLKVVGLKRVRIGKVMLGNLPVGQWRYLAPHERF